MPVYVRCPHCEHPHVIAAHRRGKALYCRQCGSLYQTSQATNLVKPLPVRSISELRPAQAKRQNVYVIEV